jgi:hypothetical protein
MTGGAPLDHRRYNPLVRSVVGDDMPALSALAVVTVFTAGGCVPAIPSPSSGHASESAPIANPSALPESSTEFETPTTTVIATPAEADAIRPTSSVVRRGRS